MTTQTKTWEIRTWLLPLAAVLVFSVGNARGQDPSLPVPDEMPNTEVTTASQDIFRLGSDVTIGFDETVGDLAVIGGTATIEGEVRGDVFVLGSAVLAGTARVRGEMAVIGGSLEVADGAAIEGDLAVVGASLQAPPDFVPGGERLIVGTAGFRNKDLPAVQWFSEGLLWGRPIVPAMGWVWAVVALLAFVYLVINLVFDRPVRACSEFLEKKPLTAGLAGVLTLVLVPPISVLLTLTIVGLPLVPFLGLALLVGAVFGRVAVARWLGRTIVSEDPSRGAWHASRSLILGMAIICALYSVPVVGLLTWFSMGILGLGAVVASVIGGLRREHPPSNRPAVSVPVSDRVDPDRYAKAAPVDLLQVSGFAPRLGAVVLDGILVALGTAPFGFDGEVVIVIFLAYHVALWAWKSTTVGGIICQVRVVRSDGTPLTFGDALVRGLAAIFSVAVVGLGWFWALWDPSRQTWHDKIAKTYLVRAPSESIPPVDSGPDTTNTTDASEASPQGDSPSAADVPSEAERADQQQ